MHGGFARFVSVAVSVALVFYCLVPVPVGIEQVDNRIDKAEAIAPAIPAMIVIGTAIAASGVYVAGTTTVEYNGNLTSLANAVQQTWEAAHTSSEPHDWNGVVSNAVTADGKVSMQRLQEAGVIDAIHETVTTGAWGDKVITGTNSLEVPSEFYINFGDDRMNVINELPAEPYSILMQNRPEYSNGVYMLNVKESGDLYIFRNFFPCFFLRFLSLPDLERLHRFCLPFLALCTFKNPRAFPEQNKTHDRPDEIHEHYNGCHFTLPS